MADGKIIIETEVDSSGAKDGVNEVNKELEKMGENVPRNAKRTYDAYGNELDSLGRRVNRTYQGMSDEARAMSQEMQNAFREQANEMRRYKDDLIKSEYAYYKLAKSSGTYTKSNKQFMDQLRKTGEEHKRATDNMIKNNELAKASYFKTVGQMLSRSTQASKIAAEYSRMGNPLYQVNRAALGVADGLNKIAMQGSPAALALQKLGPNANMKELQEMTQMISQGMMRMTQVAMGAAITSALLYSSLHKAAMKSVSGYEEAFNRMGKAVRKAFEPMVQVFGEVMKKVYEFVTVVADLVSEFNEAHPVMAKVIQGFLMLIPALMLILAPLAAGIGLLAGYKLAMFAVWQVVGPLITGLAAMSGTVYIVAAAIVAMVTAFKNVYKENERFAKAIDSLREKLGGGFMTVLKAVLKAVQTVFSGLVKAFTVVFEVIFNVVTKVVEFADVLREANPLVYSIIKGLLLLGGAVGAVMVAMSSPALMAFLTAFVSTVGVIPLIIAGLVALGVGLTALYQNNEKFASAVNAAWTKIKAKAQEVFGFLVPFLTPIVNKVKELFKQISAGVMAALSGDFTKIGELFAQLVPSLIGFLIGGLPGLLIAASRFIPTIVQGIQSNSASFATTATNLINQFVQFITTALPQLIQQGVTILQNLVMGIVQALPVLIGAVSQILNFLVTTITTLLPVLLQAGVTILTAILNAIITNLPILLDAGMQIITTLLNAIVTLLPMLLQAGLDILMALVNAIVTNLPLILDAALQIIMTLINGIIQVLPTLIPVALEIIMTIVNMLVQNLPLILQAGIDILMMLIQGITQILPQLVTTAVDLITQIANAIATQLPVIIEAGVQILTSLITGVMQTLPQLIAAAGELMMALLDAIIQNAPALLDAGIQLIQALLEGIVSLKGAVIDAAKSIGTSVIDTFSSIDLYSIGADIVNGLISGVKSMAGEAMSVVKNLSSQIMDAATGFFGIHSPSRLMRDEVGKHLPTGIAVGVKANTGAAMKAMQGLGNEMMMKTPRNFASSMSRNGSIARPQSQAIGSQKIEIISMMDTEVVGRAVVPIINGRQQQQATIKNFMQGGKN